MDNLFDAKLKDEIQIMTDKLKDQQELIEEEKKSNQVVREDLKKDQEKMNTVQNQKIEKMEDQLKKALEDGKKGQQEDFENFKKEVKEKLDKHEKRLDEAELNMVMQEMINKVAQDHMDDKFEEALKEVAKGIDDYVGIVNDTSNKQYEDFNKKLKDSFGDNLKQI